MDKIKPVANNQLARIVLAAFVVYAVAFFSFSLAAQETSTDVQAALADDDATPKLTLKDVEAALAAIEADARINAAEKDLLRTKYKQAIETLTQAADFATQTAGYREAIKTASERTSELRAQLERLPLAESIAEITPTGSTEDIQKDIDSRRAALSDLNDVLSKIRSELTRVKKRPFEISSRLPESQRELSDIRKQLGSAIFAEDVTSHDRVAERIALQAAQLRLLDESAMLEQEQLSLSVREDLLQAQYELLKRRVMIDETALAAHERLLQQRLTSEATHVGSLTETIPEDMPEGDEAAMALAAEVKALAKEFENVVQNLKNLKTAKDDIVSKLEDLNEQYEVVREELEAGGGGRGMTQLILDMRRRFPDDLAYVDGLMTQVAPLEETRLAAFQIRAKLRRQAEVEKQFSNHPAETVATLVTTRQNVLEQLRTQYGNLTRSLAVLEGDKRRYLDKAKEVRAFVSEQLIGFGLRSAPPLSAQTFSGVPDGIQWLFKADHWMELGRILQGTANRNPVLGMTIAFITIVLLLLRRWMSTALERTAAKVRRASTDSYAYTGEALLWTTLLAVPIPLLIGFTAWALQQSPESSAWIRGIADGLHKGTWMIIVLAFLAAVCRPGGLGAVHFRWPEKPLVRFRLAIIWFAVIYIPGLLITYSGLYEETSNYLFSVGRFSFMLVLLGMVIVLWQVFHFSDGILARFMIEHPADLTTRWRYLWFLLMLAIPLALVVVAGLGYIFTALELSLGLLESAAVIAGGVIFYWLTRRWFRVKQRKLALAEALERRRVRQEAEVQQGYHSGDVVAIDPEDEQKLNLVSIDEQTRDLLRLLFSLGVAVAILFVWSDNFPVFAIFDAIPIPLAKGLTLLGLARAILIAVVTYIAVRNLPGVLELAVLRATTVDAGSRNAISTLCQYAVIAIGLSLLFNALNLDWAKLGWIAAALSVGIGFGLQEVVANFVCGIIVLFERPIRVGDFVTVDGVSGTVSKIRIRATTIINGDRQDFVVPNKRLITGSLLNWTLSAGTNRVIIRLGVACGSDTDKARQILLDVAADHPFVLDEPMPIATFEQFGDSSLDLVLYAYLPDLDNRTNTISELHTEINKRFTAAGIDIPNPQFDVHHLYDKEE